MFTNEELKRIREMSPNRNAFSERREAMFGAKQDIELEERMKLEREPKGTLMKTLDYLARPMYASAAFSNSLFAEREGLEEALGHAWKGMKGEERRTYSDVLENLGVRNKYVRSIAGFVLDVGLDPTTYLTFGKGAGIRLGLTTLNKGGKELLKGSLRQWMPQYTKKYLGKNIKQKLAAQMAEEEIRENVLRMAFRNPEKYIEKRALRMFGKKIPILSDAVSWGVEEVKDKVGKKIGEKIVQSTPYRWLGESFIGDEFIIKHLKKATPLQKNLLELQRQHHAIRLSTGYNEAKIFVRNFIRQFPKLEDRETIAHLVEGKRRITGREDLTKAAEEIRNFLDENITLPEMRQGLLTSFKGNYFPHIYPERIGKLLGKKVPRLIVGINKFGKSRIFETLDEAIKLGYQPIEDAGVATGLRYAYSQKLLAADDYTQKMLSTVGTRINRKSLNQILKEGGGKLPEGMSVYIPRNRARFYPLDNSSKSLSEQKIAQKAIDILMEEGVGTFSDKMLLEIRPTPLGNALKISDNIPAYLVPREIAEMMNRKSPYLVKENKAFLEYFDQVTDFWKASVTSWFPAFHARNAMSNAWLMYLGGVREIDVLSRLKTSFEIQKYGYMERMGKNPKDFVVKLGKQEFKASELYRISSEMDVLGGAWYGRELGGAYEKELIKQADKRAKWKQIPREWFMEKPRGIGTAIENNSRLALFLDRIAKGDDFYSANLHTKKFLFDYGDLADFEKNVMRRSMPFYCVSEDTEVLTQNGWKNIDTLQKGELMYTINLRTQELELKPCLEVAKFDCDQEIIKLQNRNIDLMITPEHKCIYHTRSGSTGTWSKIGWRLKEAKDLQQTDWLPITTNGYRKQKKEIYSDDFVRLIGWIITEGSYNPNYISISQSPKNYLGEIKKLICNHLGYQTYKSKKDVVIISIKNSRAIWKELPEKKLTLDFINKLSFRQMNILFETMIKGDGCQSYKDKVFIQKEKETAENFQILATLLGYSTKLTLLTKFSRGRYSNKPIYWVRIKKVKNVEVRNTNKEWVHYKGRVYCPANENKTMVVRRNGIVVPTGRTWLRKNLPLQLEQLIEQPGKFSKVEKARIAIERLTTPPDEKYMPDWMEREMFVRIRGEEDGLPLYIKPDFAFQDLAMLNLKNPDVLRSWLSTLNPILKLPFETLTNYSLFRGRNIADVNLPEDIQFREALKESLLNNLRISGYYRRLSREDISMIDKMFDVWLGIRVYPYEEKKQRYWYNKQRKKEKDALRRMEIRKRREKQ